MSSRKTDLDPNITGRAGTLRFAMQEAFVAADLLAI